MSRRSGLLNPPVEMSALRGAVEHMQGKLEGAEATLCGTQMAHEEYLRCFSRVQTLREVTKDLRELYARAIQT